MNLPCVGALACAAFFAASPALAHAILIDSIPAPNGTLPAGARPLHLRFNSRIDRDRSRVSLTEPGGTLKVLDLAAEGPPNVIDTQAMLVPGAYVLRWQVLAVDGHITRGIVPFSVTAP